MSNTQKRASYVARSLEEAAVNIKREIDRGTDDRALAEFVVHEVLWRIPNTGMDMFFSDVARDQGED